MSLSKNQFTDPQNDIGLPIKEPEVFIEHLADDEVIKAPNSRQRVFLFSRALSKKCGPRRLCMDWLGFSNPTIGY